MNVLDLAISHGLQPKHVAATHGGEFQSACPFCGSDKRLKIWPEQNEHRGSFRCFGCDSWGDNITWVMKTKNIKYREACEVVGVTPAEKNRSFRSGWKASPILPAVMNPIHVPKEPAPATDITDMALWSEHAQKLVSWAADRLPGSPGENLLKSKGITLETANRLQLGWISEDVYRTRESWGLPTVMSEKTGKPKRLWFPQGLVIPHFSIKVGARFVDRIRIRRPEGDPRYYVIPGSSSAQMVLGESDRFVMIVESELDAILIDQIAGQITSVIAIGTSAAKPDRPAADVLIKASHITIALDADDAGNKASAWWRQNYQQVNVNPVPVGKDPSEAFQAGVNIYDWVISGWPEGLRTVALQLAGKKTCRKVMDETRQSDPQAAETAMAASEVVQDSPVDADDNGDPIGSLYRLMRKNPKITIYVSDSRLALRAPAEWRSRNESVFGKISHKIYFDPSVFAYLHAHGAREITSNNLMEAIQ